VDRGWLPSFVRSLPFGDELPDGGDELVNAFSQGLVFSVRLGGEFIHAVPELVEAVRYLLEAEAGFDGERPDLVAEVVGLALAVPPECFVLFAVLVSLFGDAGGNAFEAVEAFVGGHGVALSDLLCHSLWFWRLVADALALDLARGLVGDARCALPEAGERVVGGFAYGDFGRPNKTFSINHLSGSLWPGLHTLFTP